MSELPARPSKEHLRKQAKRLARDKSLGLAEAQRKVAAAYGAGTWADLMRRVDAARGGEALPLPPLAAAARSGDLATVRRLIAEGQPIDDGGAATGTPLWQACASDAPADVRMAIADALLSAGASPRHDNGGETALHAAANRGPLALVELLIRKGALEWQPDAKGRPPLAAARRGKAADKAAIIELLARPVIRDRSFRAAVTALQQGDVAALARLLDDEPRLLSERILEPDCYREASRSQYFRDPKLFWFIANNPTLMKRMPDNIVEVAETMIDRGVDKADLDYALELVMTSLPAREQGLQIPLLERLMKAGATPTTKAIDVTLAHWELVPIQALLRAGHPMTAPIAAALGRTDRLEALLREASPEEIQNVFGMAVINRQVEAARLALDAGADVNGFLPVHAHSTALHQAAIDENLELMELLVARGARTDVADKLWSSTPLGWATHQGKSRAAAYLERVASRAQGQDP
jgi:ankyrin repeat protein